MVISEPTAPVPARYRLIEEVGQGGMAVVYRATDDSLKRDVAVKVLHRHLSSEPESKARLEREAQAVAKLRHDNILEIFDYSGSDAETAYIVTEFIDGQTLKQFLAQRALRHPEVAMLIAAELCGALVHAHGMGIIHRDIKPENVMIRNDGLLKLMDFGIAQVLDLERMTVTGQLLGSPAYMAPELVEGKPLDVRTDVFSVGILLYQMATGVLPFSGKNPHEVLRRITEGRFPDPCGLNRLVGAGLSRIITRALARQPDARYPDMRTLLVDLTEQLTDAGLGAPRGELAAFFAAPEAFERALPDRMTPALVATADRNMALRNSARAIEGWNRVLAYAPHEPNVSAALRRFQGRGRRRRLVVIALGATAATALLVGATRLLPAKKAPIVHVASHVTSNVTSKESAFGGPPRRDPETPSAARPLDVPATANGGMPTGAASARPSTAPASAASTSAPRGAVPRVVHPHPPAERVAETVEVAAGSVGSRTFTLGPTPQNVDVYLDGERQFAYDTDHRNLTVNWNTNHQLEFRSPSGCCFVERVEIGPDRPVPPENVIARKLKWRPARLTVTTEPEASDVRIMVRDPARPGRGTVISPAEEANIPFLATDEAQKEIELSIDSSAGVFGERVTVRAGERKAVVVALKRVGAGPGGP